MLLSLVIHNSFISDVYMEDISDITCQIHHLHLEQYFIQQKMIKITKNYVSITILNINT